MMNLKEKNVHVKIFNGILYALLSVNGSKVWCMLLKMSFIQKMLLKQSQIFKNVEHRKVTHFL